MTRRLCKTFLHQADDIWTSICEAQKFGLSYTEETITENFLLHLKKYNPNEIHFKSFKKKEERINGADWEWWIGRNGQWNGMRVQAKRIKLPDEKFESLFYKSKKAINRQIDYLIESAKNNNLTPIFTLYCYSENVTQLREMKQHCYERWNGPFYQSGCLVAHAQNIESRGSKKLEDIMNFSFPWHLLVCKCPTEFDQNSLQGGLSNNLQDLFGTFNNGPRDDNDEESLFVGEPRYDLPDHMRFVLKESEERPDFIEEYCEKWDLGGLAVINSGQSR